MDEKYPRATTSIRAIPDYNRWNARVAGYRFYRSASDRIGFGFCSYLDNVIRMCAIFANTAGKQYARKFRRPVRPRDGATGSRRKSVGKTETFVGTVDAGGFFVLLFGKLSGTVAPRTNVTTAATLSNRVTKGCDRRPCHVRSRRKRTKIYGALVQARTIDRMLHYTRP